MKDALEVLRLHSVLEVHRLPVTVVEAVVKAAVADPEVEVAKKVETADLEVETADLEVEIADLEVEIKDLEVEGKK